MFFGSRYDVQVSMTSTSASNSSVFTFRQFVAASRRPCTVLGNSSSNSASACTVSSNMSTFWSLSARKVFERGRFSRKPSSPVYSPASRSRVACKYYTIVRRVYLCNNNRGYAPARHIITFALHSLPAPTVPMISSSSFSSSTSTLPLPVRGKM